MHDFHFVDRNDDKKIDADETATLSFRDPWGAVDLVGTLTMDGDFLKLIYTGGAADGGNSGRIQIALSESIPEPVTALAALLSISSLTGYLRRRQGATD